MHRKAFVPVACAALMAFVTLSCNRTIEFGKSSMKKVVAAMTLEEKVNLLVVCHAPGWSRRTAHQSYTSE